MLMLLVLGHRLSSNRGNCENLKLVWDRVNKKDPEKTEILNWTLANSNQEDLGFAMKQNKELGRNPDFIQSINNL